MSLDWLSIFSTLIGLYMRTILSFTRDCLKWSTFWRFKPIPSCSKGRFSSFYMVSNFWYSFGFRPCIGCNCWYAMSISLYVVHLQKNRKSGWNLTFLGPSLDKTSDLSLSQRISLGIPKLRRHSEIARSQDACDISGHIQKNCLWDQV